MKDAPAEVRGNTFTDAKVPEVVKNMLAAADTYRERAKLYGDNYREIGGVLQNVFPNGIKAATLEDWNRTAIIITMCIKLTRYTHHMDTHQGKGHKDSAHDLGVYAFMLEELT